jgi:hypothetical protein
MKILILTVKIIQSLGIYPGRPSDILCLPHSITYNKSNMIVSIVLCVVTFLLLKKFVAMAHEERQNVKKDYYNK